MIITDINGFSGQLKQFLAEPLPGKLAQYKMAPSYRPDLDSTQIASLNPRIGGVLVLSYPINQEMHLVFTQRHQYDGVHSGQMSFPGGKKEENDLNIIHTALREAEEEVGIAADQVQVLGMLSELYIPPSNFLVYPTVGVLSERPQFSAQITEVKEIVEIPVSFFTRPENIRSTSVPVMKGMKVEVPAYIYKDYVIWGATAIILSEFAAVMENFER